MTDSDSLPALIQAIAEADSAPKVVEAVEKLAQARQIAAIPNLITILGYNNPGAAVAAVAGLIDVGKPAVEPLLELLDGYNYGARAWGLRALAGIGDPRALNLLLDAAENDFALSVRRAATRGLGTIRWEELPGEEIAPAQSKVNEVLARVALDNEWVVRYAAITGLQELAIASIVRNPDVTRQILERFDRLVEGENNLAVIARIWLAQKEIQTAITEILTQLPTHEPQISNGLPSVLSRFLPEGTSGAHAAATAIDWQATLEKLYTRKRQEQPTPEGDPRKFRAAAAAIIKGEQS